MDHVSQHSITSPLAHTISDFDLMSLMGDFSSIAALSPAPPPPTEFGSGIDDSVDDNCNTTDDNARRQANSTADAVGDADEPMISLLNLTPTTTTRLHIPETTTPVHVCLLFAVCAPRTHRRCMTYFHLGYVLLLHVCVCVCVCANTAKQLAHASAKDTAS
jgi:hypothetical protein